MNSDKISNISTLEEVPADSLWIPEEKKTNYWELKAW